MGQAGAHIADIIMEDVKLPADALLGGEEGRGFAPCHEKPRPTVVSVGAAATGYAPGAHSTARSANANERKAFGEPIANFQLIQQMLADSEIEI